MREGRGAVGEFAAVFAIHGFLGFGFVRAVALGAMLLDGLADAVGLFAVAVGHGRLLNWTPVGGGGRAGEVGATSTHVPYLWRSGTKREALFVR